MKFVKQSLVLIFSFATVYLWRQTFLADYTIQIIAVLIFLYLILSARNKDFSHLSFGGESISVFTLSTIILLLVFSTGGFSSNLFFLLYFLGFGIALVFDPTMVFIFVLGMGLLFLPDAVANDVVRNFIMLGSILLISPLAFFFGREFKKEEESSGKMEAMAERTKDAADTISEDVESILENEKDKLQQGDVEKLNEILEETEDLRQESK